MQKILKIGIISRNFPPVICGVGDYSYWLATILKNLNYEVGIITSGLENKNPPPNKDLNTVEIGNSWNPIKLITAVTSLKPDIVILQYVCQMYGRAGLIPGLVLFVLLTKLFFPHTKLLVVFHELWIPLKPREFILGIIQRLETGIIIITANAGIVTTISREKAIHKLFPWKKIYKVPVSSNVPINSVMQNNTSALNIGQSEKSNLIISTFGRIHPERDLITVMKAIGIVCKNYNSVSLKIIGKIDKGKEYNAILEEIKKLNIEKNIVWTSSCSPEEIANHLRESNIYLSPELDGASGRRTTMMAALSFGLPIIAYDGYDTEKTFKNGQNIILIPPKNPGILAENIIKLANNKNLMIKLGWEARKTFEAQFSWDNIGRKYEEILKSFGK